MGTSLTLLYTGMIVLLDVFTPGENQTLLYCDVHI